MALKKINIMHKQDILVPARAVERLLDTRNGGAALTYLYILSRNGELDEDAACARLRLSREELSAALDVLRRHELIDTGAPEPQAEAEPAPDFSPEDLHTLLDTDPAFSALVDFTQSKLGKILTTAELEMLARINRHLGLPADVIFLLISSCVAYTEKRYGSGRKPTMRSIVSTAKTWERLGLFNCELAESYLKEQELRSRRVSQLARLLYISSRPLSKTELAYLTDWAAMELSDELILLAYDSTVVKTGMLTWKYMNTILKDWHAKGYKTARDVEQAEKARKAQSAAPQQEELDSMHRLRSINRKRRGEGNDI